MAARADASGGIAKLERAKVSGPAMARAVGFETALIASDVAGVTPVRTGNLQRHTDGRIETQPERIVVRIGWFNVPYARHVERRRNIIRNYALPIAQRLRDALNRGLADARRR